MIGPLAPDVAFPQAIAQRAHGVVCMYHDQANIARKLFGFSGATLFVGLPVPVATTAHGVAFDRAGAGTADPSEPAPRLRAARPAGGAERVSATLVERLRALGVASVFDASEPRVTAGPGIRPVWTPVFAAGPAYTLETEPADNLALHRAIGEAPPGSIVVAATGRSVAIAVYGDLLSEIAVGRGLAGLVTDGAVRDIDRIAALGFPVFSAGVTVRAPSKRCWGEVGGSRHHRRGDDRRGRLGPRRR